MTTIIDDNMFGAIKEETLIKFESTLGHILPAGYRDFLVKYNGGPPSPNYFEITAGDNISKIHHFYGIHDGPEYLRLDVTNELLKDRLPHNMIAIADDPFGNYICIGLSQDNLGKIYFIEHDQPLATSENLQYYEIADGFSNFVSNCFQWIDESLSDLEKIIKDDDVEKLESMIEELDIEKLDEHSRSMMENAVINNSVKIIKFLYSKGANLRNSISLAERNAEFFDEYNKLVSFLKSLR